MLRAAEKDRSNETSAGAGFIGEESPAPGTRLPDRKVPTGHSEDQRPCEHAAGQHGWVQRERGKMGLAEQARRGTELRREPWGEAKAAGRDARGAGPRRRAGGQQEPGCGLMAAREWSREAFSTAASPVPWPASKGTGGDHTRAPHSRWLSPNGPSP